MASSVHLCIIDSRNGSVRVRRWLGGSAVVDRIRDVVRSTPDSAPARGDESWSVSPNDVVALQSSFFSEAPSQEELMQWATLFGASDFWWFVERNF